MVFPKFYPKQRREPRFWTDLLIVAAALMDWLPSYVQATLSGGVESEIIVSGSKLLILPLLCIDFFKSKAYWLGNVRIPLIAVGILFLLFLPYVFHPSYAPFARLSPYIFNVFLLMYFSHSRSFDRCKLLMLFSVFCASAVPFSQVLVQVGILQPLQEHKAAGESVERVFAVTRTATIGVFSAYCLAFFGGLVCVQHMRRWYLFLPISLVIVAASLATPLFTSQRTVAIVGGLAPLGGFVVFARARAVAALFLGIAAVLIGPLILALLSPDLIDRWYYLMQRFAGVDLGGGFGTESSAYFRYQEVMTVLERMIPFPEVIGPGVVAYTSVTGIAPHTFIGAIYYDGGVILLLLYIGFITYLGVSHFRLYFMLRDPVRRALVGAYLVYFCAFILNSLVMPVMGDRVMPFTLGLGVSLLAACRSSSMHGHRLMHRR